MKLGFIGTGNMATAIIGGLLSKGIAESGDIIGSARTEEHRKKAEDSLKIRMTADNAEVVRESEILFLCVKPQMIEGVINEIKDEVRQDQLIISIIAGKSIAWFENAFGKKIRLIRTMPNTPALVGEGMTAAVMGENVSEDEKELALKLLGACGQVEIVTEKLMDAVVAVSGSSPAYIFILIEAMADAAVSEGMPRAQAYKFAAQAVLGSAKMALESGRHPAELKDMVCSPAGTTIEAVRVLEERGFRSSIIEAMKACAEVNRNL